TNTVVRKIRAGDKPWGVIVVSGEMGAAFPREQPRDISALPAAKSPEQYYRVDPASAGKLRGEVRFEGKPPAPRRISLDAEKASKDMHNSPVYDGKVLVGKQGGIANVFIYVKSGLEGKAFATAPQTIVLEQRGCEFVPRVMGVQAGQTLDIRNSDPVSHNIH